MTHMNFNPANSFKYNFNNNVVNNENKRIPLPGIAPALIDTIKDRKENNVIENIITPFGMDLGLNLAKNNIQFGKAVANNTLENIKTVADSVKDTVEERKNYGFIKKLLVPFGVDLAKNQVTNTLAKLGDNSNMQVIKL